MLDYWQKQDKSKPLYEDLLWSRPEHKSQQGSLLIIGGNIHAITAPSRAYGIAIQQRIGHARVIMPDKTIKIVGPHLPDIEFLPSTSVGSLGLSAFVSIKTSATQTNAILLAGDFAKNSETSVLLEQIARLPGLQIYTQDALDAFTKTPALLLDRPETLLVIDFARLQKFISYSHFEHALTSDIGVVQMVELLNIFSLKHQSYILTRLDNVYLVVAKGQVVTTKLSSELTLPSVAAAAAVWWLQTPQKPLQAIATALTCI